jgi:hypothetical protein
VANPFADLIPQQGQQAPQQMQSANPFADLVPAQPAQTAPQPTVSVPRGNTAQSGFMSYFNAPDNMGTFLADTTAFNAGVGKLAHGILQPLFENSNGSLAQASRDVAARRESNYKKALGADPIGATRAEAIGNAALPMILTRGTGWVSAPATGFVIGGANYVNPGESRLTNAEYGAAGGLLGKAGGSIANAAIRKGAEKYAQSAMPGLVAKATARIKRYISPEEASQKLQANFNEAAAKNTANWNKTNTLAQTLDNNLADKGKAFDASPFTNHIQDFSNKLKGMEPAVRAKYAQAADFANHIQEQAPQSFSGAVALRQNLNQELKKFLDKNNVKVTDTETKNLITGLKNSLQKTVDANADKFGSDLELYHGSNGIVNEINDYDGLFGGIFASPSKNAALSHGNNLHTVKLNEPDILTQEKLAYHTDDNKVRNILKDNLGDMSNDELDEIHDLVINDRNLHRSDLDPERLNEIFRTDDLGEASWQAQRMRGAIAKDLGYKAVEMDDEHGTSYLVLPGAKIYPPGTEKESNTFDQFKNSWEAANQSHQALTDFVKTPNPQGVLKPRIPRREALNNKTLDAGALGQYLRPSMRGDTGINQLNKLTGSDDAARSYLMRNVIEGRGNPNVALSNYEKLSVPQRQRLFDNLPEGQQLKAASAVRNAFPEPKGSLTLEMLKHKLGGAVGTIGTLGIPKMAAKFATPQSVMRAVNRAQTTNKKAGRYLSPVLASMFASMGDNS